MKKVVVWINQAKGRFSQGYRPGDSLMPAMFFDAPEDMEVNEILEQTFVMLNVDEHPPLIGNVDETAIREYHRTFPSLSVGDVIEVDTVRYACEAMGWKQVQDAPYFGRCSLCHIERWLQPYGKYGVCADCEQGDPVADLGLMEAE